MLNGPMPAVVTAAMMQMKFLNGERLVMVRELVAEVSCSDWPVSTTVTLIT